MSSQTLLHTMDDSAGRMAGRRLVVLLAMSTLWFLGAAPVFGQGHEPGSKPETASEHSAEHEFHRNHFGGLLGVSFHHDSDESALTLGLEYARQFTRHLAVGSYLELVSSDLERNVIVAIGVGYYPIKRLGLVLAPGVELATYEVEEHGEVKLEDESEFLLRLGIAYTVPLTSQASLGPAVFIDRAGDKWTTLVSLAMIVGF